jgi:hypothetical protein
MRETVEMDPFNSRSGHKLRVWRFLVVELLTQPCDVVEYYNFFRAGSVHMN